MCARLVAAWGNARFGRPEDPAEVGLAAERHEAGMRDWDARPALDPASGLPAAVTRIALDEHLPMRLRAAELLAERSPYAALLVSLHHASFYARPPAYGLLRSRGRLIRDYLDRSAAFQARQRSATGAADPGVEHDWRLLRAVDGLSHDLLHGRAPCTRRDVPALPGELVDLRLEPRGEEIAVDPWPFTGSSVRSATDGRLLRETFADAGRMHAALAAAPAVTLAYELVPA